MSREHWISALRRQQRLPADYEASAGPVLSSLAARIGALRAARARPLVIGVCGAQGSGKTTLCLFLEQWLRRECGLNVATVSLDDLYLTRAERRRQAQSVHPLLATRGVPGTHDVGLGLRLLDDLTSASGSVALPRFDKATDDRAPAADWPLAETPVDIVLFEGWCVGARPQDAAALREPVNDLEALEDPDALWRRYVNDRLGGDYAGLFARLDALVLLRVPSFDKVLEWRGLQEQKLTGDVDAGQMRRFVSHFERLTRHVLATMPAYADAVIDVHGDHRLGGIEIRG